MPGIPGRLAFFGRLPDDEVAGVLLVVLVAVDAGAALDALVIETRELAVLGKGRNLEVDGPVAAIRVAARFERPDRLPHRLDVLGIGGARALFHDLEAKRRRILAVRLDVAVGVFAQRHAGLLRLEDGAVVDVGEVHDVPDVEAGLILQRAAQHVDGDKRPEVADVAAGIGGQPARVHPDGVVAEWCERFLATSQRVEEAHGDQAWEEQLRRTLTADSRRR